jgi:hypothetical protein
MRGEWVKKIEQLNCKNEKKKKLIHRTKRLNTHQYHRTCNSGSFRLAQSYSRLRRPEVIQRNSSVYVVRVWDNKERRNRKKN